MAITIGTANFSNLTAQPFGYEETDTRAGLTARKWLVTGLLEPSEWLALLGVYDTWRNTRINDEPTKTSGVVGHTITFSGDGPSTQSWSNVACWFIGAPQAEQSGKYLRASVELVDANQSLAVILKAEQQAAEESEDLPDLGTITIGTTVLKLLQPVDTFGAGPQLELTASGVHYVTGPLVAEKIRNVSGTTDSAGWSAIVAWYESQVGTIPSPNSYFPISPPTATAANAVVSGVTIVQYTVSLQLVRVI